MQNATAVSATIPLPIQIVIDDVGWWCGADGSERGEPFRTGINRDHVPADYEAVVELGQQLNMRPQAAMILCEWDRANFLRDLPSATWMGGDWDNSRWVGPWQEQAAEIIRNNRAHFELTLHGVGHEFWEQQPDGGWGFTRAEWHDTRGDMRSRQEVQRHLDAFQSILNQHDLGGFPSSFVPCAFLHRFHAAQSQDEGLATLLKAPGVSFISTPFSTMFGAEEANLGTPDAAYGIDAGVLTVDRGRDLLRWYDIGMRPQGELDGPICGMHWPNILHHDPDRNCEVVAAWVELLRKTSGRLDRILAPDTAWFVNQMAHYAQISCRQKDDRMELDCTRLRPLPGQERGMAFAIKVSSPVALEFTALNLTIDSIDLVRSSRNLGYTIMAQIQSSRPGAELRWTVASSGDG